MSFYIKKKNPFNLIYNIIKSNKLASTFYFKKKILDINSRNMIHKNIFHKNNIITKKHFNDS